MPQLLVLLHQEDHIAQVHAFSPCSNWRGRGATTAAATNLIVVEFEFLGFRSADGSQGGRIGFRMSEMKNKHFFWGAAKDK